MKAPHVPPFLVDCDDAFSVAALVLAWMYGVMWGSAHPRLRSRTRLSVISGTNLAMMPGTSSRPLPG